VYTLWTILFLPVLLLLLVIAVDISHLWLARGELENSLEAAALAAVKQWGDSGVVDTAIPRSVGMDYAAANTINGLPVAIQSNYDANNTPNQNASCSGNLVLGAVSRQPGVTCPRYIFDTSVQPTCGAGVVLFDASNNGNLRTGSNNEWGIAFQRNNSLATTLKIERVTIDLKSNTPLYFDVDTGLGVSNNTSPFKVTDGGGQSQRDLRGFTSPATQIQWSFDAPSRAKVLTFNFYPDPATGDQGFQPCDRFRFGVNVVRENGSSQFNGDDIGDYRVRVGVVFSQAGVLLPTVYAELENTWTNGTCGYQGDDPFCPNSIIVSPAGIPDLPCPPVPGQGNNPDGQSYVRLPGGGTGAFGVRAQASVAVKSLLCQWCGVSFGPFQVSACATAMYDCAERVPRLIRVEKDDFYCP
jgi:hypothetical protein